MGKTSNEVKRRYNEKTYSRIVADIPKATAEAFREKCSAEGVSQAQVIKSAIDEYLKK